MYKSSWNTGWTMAKPGENPMIAALSGNLGDIEYLTLPHDAMIHEKRTLDTKNQHQTGFYPGGCYTYNKNFEAPLEWQEKTVLIEFEGVYQEGRVYINGDYAGGCHNGYTEFTIKADDFLKYGETNTVTVIANNSAEENSRWYSGSGIYRNVNLLIGDKIHLKQNSLRILTPEIDAEVAVVEVNAQLVNLSRIRTKTRVKVELLDADHTAAASVDLPICMFAGECEEFSTRLQIEKPSLWSCENPILYTCRITVEHESRILDQTESMFGIRSVSMNAKHGLSINGKEVKLRGACIHHDNGVIGAVTLGRAEERRVQQLKAAGFNSIRSSHHPMSRAMLDACDREGILVLDELGDCWTRSKNNNDYAQHFPTEWEKDVEALVAKDFNHPSVIMYISGNEIQEASTSKGAQLNRKITKKFHSLDHTRYVTVAINGLLSCMNRIGDIMCDITGMTMEQMMAMQAEPQEAPKSDAGADAANGNTDLMKGPMADAFASNHIVTEMLEEFEAVTDLVGLNYLTARHVLEHELNSNRVILGTETLPSDIARLWKIVTENPHVIGDMTWTGYDYIGEAGSGCFYYDGRQGFMPNWPISLAGMGDIDLIGNRRPVSYYREIVFGLRHEPYIAVEPLNHYGQQHSPNTWQWKDEIESWTWYGYEGKGAVVNVYSDADEVELFLNGKSIGRKPAGRENGYYAAFETLYAAGTLKAVCYRNGIAAEFTELSTADSAVKPHIDIDRSTLRADGADLSYLMISLRDNMGRKNMQTAKTVTVTVEGAGTLQGMGTADPATGNSYDHNSWITFEGSVLAVVRAGNEQGEIKVTVTTDEGWQEVRTISVR